jgi:hypothetical protein
MSKRLQVVMGEAEYEDIRQAASSARTTVSEWVRRSLREARRPEKGGSSGEGGRPGIGTAVREPAPTYGNLLERVMQRYGLPDPDAALRFALRRAADPPLSREEILAMEGTGWEGDLADLRSSESPEKLP